MARRMKRGWAALVPRTPPEGLWEHALEIGRRSDDGGSLDCFGLVYEKVFVPDKSPAGVMGDRAGKKIPMVLCRCSACGQESLMPYVRGEASDGATYGFTVEGASCCSDVAMSGDGFLCPACESQVAVKCKSKVGGDWFARDAFVTARSYCMSAVLLPGESGERPLALVGWELRRYCSKGGGDKRVVIPYEAYVFDAAGCTKLQGWHKAYGGYSGYYTEYWQEWHEYPSGWEESWGDSGPIFGLTEELLDESCLKNSALLDYMGGGLVGSDKFPVIYLLLYQTRPNAENLARSRACYILDELLREELRTVGRLDKTGVPRLQEVHWEEARPSKLLGVNGQEFGLLTRRMASLELWRLFTACKRAGDRLTEADIELAHRLGDPDLIKLAGMAPMGKILRYLHRQMFDQAERVNEELRAAYEEDMENPDYDGYVMDFEDYADGYDADELEDAALLRDYWRMAGHCGWDLSRPEVRWPRDICAAHDRAAEAERAVLAKENKRLFKRRFEELSVYSFRREDIFIRPCRSQTELTREGEKLHHCVAGYANDIVLGKKAILFIRRASAPKTPWYTLELDVTAQRIVQNRGLRNCSPTEEVGAFAALWLEWVRSGCPRRSDGSPAVPKSKKRKGNVA